jgi:selina-4(15),7(11)-diene synthase
MVPPVFSPIPPAIHPRHESIDERTAAWATTFRIGSEQLRENLIAHDIGTFAARILPEGREEVVSILADFVIWLFGVDDGHCEEGELGRDPQSLVGELSRLLRVAQNPEVPMLTEDPLAEGLRDLRRRIDRAGTPGQIARWVDALREYFLSVIWEAAHRSKGTVPDLNDYTLMRLYDGATSVVLPLL